MPELRQRSAVELDHHGAELVWAPLNPLEEKQDYQQKGQGSTRRPRVQTDRVLNALLITVNDLMHLACSSVFYGGGTNQELAHHCLHQCKGDIMVSICPPTPHTHQSDWFCDCLIQHEK